jgi:hypothetical protein
LLIAFFAPDFITMAGTLGTEPSPATTTVILFDSIKMDIIPERNNATDYVKKTKSRQFTESGLCKYHCFIPILIYCHVVSDIPMLFFYLGVIFCLMDFPTVGFLPLLT